MSFNTKLMVAGFTLALLVASQHGATACERTGVWCRNKERCVAPCKGKGPPKCSWEHVVGDPSCVCGDDCDGVPSTTVPGDEPTQEKPATATVPGRRGMGMLN